MHRSLCRIGMGALLGGILTLMTTGTALAALDVFTVKDEAQLFSKDAIARANRKIEEIKKNYKVDLLVETLAKAPTDVGRASKEERDSYFRSLAKKRYDAQGVHGVYVLICNEPKSLRVDAGTEIRKKAFRDADVAELVKTFTSRLGKDADQALLAGVDEVATTLEKNIGKQTARPGAVAPAPKPGATVPVGKERGDMTGGLWGWLCLGLVAVLALWVVIGMVRGLTGARRPAQPYPAGQFGPGGPPPGYAPPPGYGQPAGGGGFMSSVLGGMLGAGAGMWAYDTFFRGGSGGSMTPPAYGGSTPTGAGDQGTGGAGGDWGSEPAAPADGGGGADWGGGNDGGGGDWGGGDGGGGDWGGGGGGDGGGGDW